VTGWPIDIKCRVLINQAKALGGNQKRAADRRPNRVFLENGWPNLSTPGEN